MESTKHFISMGFCWIIACILVSGGTGTKREWNPCFIVEEIKNPSDFSGPPLTLVNIPFSQMMFPSSMADWVVFSWKKSLSLLNKKIFFSQQDVKRGLELGQVISGQTPSSGPQRLVAIINGKLRHLDSVLQVHSRLACYLKDVTLSEDPDNKVPQIETNRSLSASERLAHWCLDFLYSVSVEIYQKWLLSQISV